jgi:hypothetical protein
MYIIALLGLPVHAWRAVELTGDTTSADVLSVSSTHLWAAAAGV